MQKSLFQDNKEAFKTFLMRNINQACEVVSLGCEQKEIIINNHAQALSKLFMMEIIEQKLPLREQFEILYVKTVLKPVITKIQDASSEGKKEEISDNEEEEKGDEVLEETPKTVDLESEKP